MRNIALIGLIGISLLWSSVDKSCAGAEGKKEVFLTPTKPVYVEEAAKDKAAAPATAGAQPILHLANGDVAPGQLQGTVDPSVLRWQCDPFTKPFEFNLALVTAIHFPQPAQQAKPIGEYGFELVGGDVLFGSLLALNDKEVAMESPTFGKLNLRRDLVRRLMRWGNAAGFVYVGPSGLSGWKEPTATINYPVHHGGPRDALLPQVNNPTPAPQQPATNQPQWWQESGHAVTDRPGASIFRDVGLPEKAIIEVELSWKNKPDFVLSLADSDQPNKPAAAGKNPQLNPGRPVPIPPQALPQQPTAEDQIGAAFRIEVLGANVIMMRDLGATADLVLLENLGPGAGRIHWQVYLDQAQGRASVYSAEGKLLNELVLDDKNAAAKVATGVRLINKRGDVRLERLRVSRWNGELPKQVDAAKSRVHKADGTLAYGEAKGYDAQRKQFIIGAAPNSPGSESRLDAAQVTSIVLSNNEVAPATTISAALQNGVRISGDLVSIAGGRIKLNSPAVVDPVSIPVAELQSLLMMNKGQAPPKDITWQSGDGTVRKVTKAQPDAAAQPGAGRVGRLELDGLKLHGELVDGEVTDEATSLVWKPIGSRNGSPLKQNMSGRIVYRDSQPRQTVQVQNPQPPAAFGGRARAVRVVQANGRVITTATEEGAPVQPPASATPSLHLRVGDNIPCEVKKIDEKGVTFYSPVTDATFVAGEKVKAVELAPEQQTKNIGKTKRERLLTLPRMQKNNPPTHLVIAKNGDFLRGRLNELNDKSLALEVRMEARDIPRDKISRIIWFHPEAKEGDAKVPPTPLGTGLVQTMRRDGARLTFVPDRCDEGVLAGKSEVLGQCRVDVSLVDQILFGKAIDDAATQLAYHPWKLQDAAEPKYVQEEAAEGNATPATGTESSLVGKAAPDFDLPLLDGGSLRLSGERGKVVVLDFFATWCGPCVQAMPNIDRTVEEFKDQNVKLVAVNMQEDAKKIKDLLERLEINPTVAIDRDGAAAEKYGVTAIPQTVVIDAQGKVARVFIGGGPKLPEQLAEAIKATLNPQKPADAQ